MEVRRLPKLRIELLEEGKSIVLRDADQNPYPFECKVTDVAARQYRQLLKDGLRKMKQSVDLDVLTITDAEAALKEFSIRGRTVLWEIFGKKTNEISEVFRKCFPTWRSSSVDPAHITIVAALSRFVPLELLPIFDAARWPDVPTTEDTLMSNARRFPGFSAMIKREFTSVVNHDLVLSNNPRLPLRCFLNPDLPAPAGEEFEFFKRNEAHIDVDGPWPPSDLTNEEFTKSISEYLQFANQKFNGGPRDPIDQIQHFICHCKIKENAYDSLLELSDYHKVEIFELINKIAEEGLSENPRERPQSAPLIFLNACSGSEIDPMGVTSFPSFFLEKNGNRGFIGTETDVPNDFAADFSQYFYRNLLGGMKLGRAMYEAKLSILREKRNPLGLIYTVYADPDLHVSDQVQVDN